MTRTATRRRTAAVLAVALAAAVTLMLGRAGSDPAEPAPTRVTAAEAWPEVQRADLPAGLPDGPLFTPLLFLDATTAVGTAPTASGADQRLVVRSAAGLRELRRLSLADNPQITAITATADEILWAESTDRDATAGIWTAARSTGPARRLTGDTGNAVFFGTEYDLVVAGHRVHWAADAGNAGTEIRSVALTGGPVQKRVEAGEWALTAWPWLVEEGSTRLRNMQTARDTEVAVTGPEVVTCDPGNCRGVALGEGDEARIDVFRPDGATRRQIASGTAQAAVADVAALDRFVILTEPRPDSDLTGTAGLTVYDLWTSRTIEVAPEAAGVFTRNGVLWWSTGDDDITWHILDLRTVAPPPGDD
ncbi:MAG: hypothetical protein ABW046_21525 [Actinoplanes sp.]